MKPRVKKPMQKKIYEGPVVSRNSHKPFDAVSVRLASPNDVLEWSCGEVKKTETINYRTQNLERDGLFCEKIFGPSVDMQCGCGKYKGSQHKGVTCERCEVTVSNSDVRRERMGHISLVSPVAHIWFLKKNPSRIALLLGIRPTDVQQVVAFASSIVTSVDTKKQKDILNTMNEEYKAQYKTVQNEATKKTLDAIFDERVREVKGVSMYSILSDEQVYTLNSRYPSFFVAEKGSDPLYTILKHLNLKTLEKELQKDIESKGATLKEKSLKRLSVVRAMLRSGVRPEWMFIKNLPVIPPDLRPLVMLEGGRYASSDINDLYRTVIIRNNRLRQMKEKYNAPEIILQNEKRLLQEAVDALLDASIRKNVGRRSDADAKKSLAEHVNQKTGHFRQHLLGKRVDFSGRSVITTGPSLRLNQCGLPKHMALEVFKPFIVAQLIKRDLVHTLRQGMRMVDDVEMYPEVWDVLEDVMKEKVVFLIRQPTLHRQNMLAFYPVLIDSNAIQIHPLVCKGYNADFDGDTMSVYLPLSDEAQAEARELMLFSNHTVNSGDGEVIAAPSTQDIALGIFWATCVEDGAKGEGRVFGNFKDVHAAYMRGTIDFRALVSVKNPYTEQFADTKEAYIQTTAGRYLFNKILPDVLPYYNTSCNKKAINKISLAIHTLSDVELTAQVFDRIKEFGFTYACFSGISQSWSDLDADLFDSKDIEKAKEKNITIIKQYEEGLLSTAEKNRMIVSLWNGLLQNITKQSLDLLDAESSMRYIIESGARGSAQDIAVGSGFLGIVRTATGAYIEVPILESFKKGLSPISIFKQSYGARSGTADTKLSVRDSGYLSRRLYDVLQDFSVRETNCGTTRGFVYTKEDTGTIGSPFTKKIEGRVASADVVGSDKKVYVKKGEKITKELAEMIQDTDSISQVSVRSPITCNTVNGVCQKCYGEDVSNGEDAVLGLGVGAIAATAIGEPGTQLNLRTFHTGGVSVGADLSVGLTRVKELVDNIKIKQVSKAVISRVQGKIVSIAQEKEGKEMIKIITLVSNESKKEADTVYKVPSSRIVTVAEGDDVEPGDRLTDGSVDISELDTIAGKEKVQHYIISEMDSVYALQGVNLRFIHFEALAHRMYGLYEVVSSQNSEFSEGDLLDEGKVYELKKKIRNKEEDPLKVRNVLKGIKQVSLNREGFLSSASFERTAEVLIRSSLEGSVDLLKGGKENAIVGRLIPFGTGFDKNPIHKKIVAITKKNKEILEELKITRQKEQEQKNIEM